ncbi:MAG TPA: protein-L-isoaspartate(D-aspartate) O-methyltransferase [Anaerolineae bacterium]|nr:protein-L-isoaspartate(D-aspartate) O-methyltransferase [Anaerolineae bacterium]HMR66258.1 protein-L-isoaspartate(D-aspartate) O-methyltransferase [Anaerolineae bacterium]
MFGKKPDFDQARTQMVQDQLTARDITDPRVLEAMRILPRHQFVQEKLWWRAYQDRPLPIGFKQTISQPYMVAFMSQALRLPPDGSGVALEIGTGSGYQAAVLSYLAAHVYSVERIEPLGLQARQILQKLGIDNVEIKISDGGYGWPDYGPYDGIIVTAAAPEIPAPLTVQLKDGGHLVAPVGPAKRQTLLRIQRRGTEFIQEELAPVAFVPLLGEHGWDD